MSAWLAENALKCGFDIKHGVKPVPQPAVTAKVGGGGRLKGKDRKKAKEAAAEFSSVSSLSTGPQYIISVSQFLPMAQAIATHKPKIKVPLVLNRLFHRVIKARRSFAKWYAEVGKTEHAASNERHTHFIDVLQATWEVLVPIEQARKATEPDRTKDVKSESGFLGSLENRFATLRVENPNDTSSSHHTTPSPSSAGEEDYRLSTNIKVKVQRDEDEVENDFFLAIYTFLNELSSARQWIRHTWEGIAVGDTRIPQAALQSNLAIQLVRRAEFGLEHSIERPKRFPVSVYPSWTLPLIFLYHKAGFLDPAKIRELPTSSRLENITKPGFMVAGNGEIWGKWGDFCFAQLFRLFHPLAYSFDSTPGQAALELVLDDFTDAEGNNLLVTFLRILAVATSANIGVAEDEVTRGIRVMASQTTAVPIWAVFGFQCLLDINTALWGHKYTSPGCVLVELKRHVIMAVKDLTQTDVWSIKPPLGFTPSYTKDLTWIIRLAEDQALKGGLTEEARKGPMGLLPALQGDPDFFLRYNPIRCGLILYNLRFQIYSRVLAIDHGLVTFLPMIHLYKMCQLVYPDMPAWPDMEFLLLHQNVNRLFFGGLPTSLRESTSKYSLAIGMAAQILPTMRSTVKPIFPRYHKMRYAENECPIGIILDSSLRGCVEDDDMVLLKLLRWLNDPRRLDSIDSLIDRISGDDGPEELGLSSKLANSKKEIHENTTFPHAGIAETANFLDLFLESERDVLGFDWIGFMCTVNEMASLVLPILCQHYPRDSLADARFSESVWELMLDVEIVEKQASRRECGPVSLSEIVPPALKEVYDALQAKGMSSSVKHKRNVRTPDGKKQEAVWYTMDRGIADLIRRHGPSNMSFLATSEQSLQDRFYKNWPPEKLERSFVILKSRAANGRAKEEEGRDEEWDEFEPPESGGRAWFLGPL